MQRNLTPPLELSSSYNNTSSFSSRTSKRSIVVAPCISPTTTTPPPLGDVDQVELQRLRAENQRNTRLLEDERRQTSELSRRVAELERALDRIKVSAHRQALVDVSIPRFVVLGPDGTMVPTEVYFGGSFRGDRSNASFTSSSSLGRGRPVMSAPSSRASSPRGSRSASPEPYDSNSNDGTTSPQATSKSKMFVAYLILVERGFPHPPGKVQVLRRFNDFKGLHRKLLKAFPKCPSIPELPDKRPGSLFSKSLSSVAEHHQRRYFLEVYLKQLLCIDEVRQSEAMHQFLVTNVREKIDVSDEALMMEDPL